MKGRLFCLRRESISEIDFSNEAIYLMQLVHNNGRNYCPTKNYNIDGQCICVKERVDCRCAEEAVNICPRVANAT